MTRQTPRVRFLVVTEDSSRGATATIEALARKLLRLVDPACQTHKLVFEPPDDAAAKVKGSRWRSTSSRDHQDIVALHRAIATRIVEDRGFVLFHVDGDRPWRDRKSCDVPDRFRQLIVAKVEQILRGQQRALEADRRRGREQRDAPALTDADIARRLARVLLLLPYYSIEAWVYQNTDAAVTLCRDRYGGRDVELFEMWRADRAAIDDHDRPKDTVCLGDRHNADLAGPGFPADQAYAAGASFAAAADTMRACDDLLAALASTRDDAAPGASGA